MQLPGSHNPITRTATQSTAELTKPTWFTADQVTRCSVIQQTIHTIHYNKKIKINQLWIKNYKICNSRDVRNRFFFIALWFLKKLGFGLE